MSDIHYEVSWAEFSPAEVDEETKKIIDKYLDEIGEDQYGPNFLPPLPEAIPSKTIDNRTYRSKSFETEEQARDYAKGKLMIIQEEDDEKWLAYMVINQITTAQILKLK